MYKKLSLMALLMAAFTFTALAQDDAGGGRPQRGNWDPAAMQARMLERLKTELGSTDDEWTVVSPLITAVFEKQRAVRELSSTGGRGRRGGGEQAEGPKEVTELKAAIEANDGAAITAKIAALRAARVARDAELASAQKNLLEVLTPAQEAKLVMAGMLD